MYCSAYESAIISEYSFGGYSALIRRRYTNSQMGVQMEGRDGGYKRGGPCLISGRWVGFDLSDRCG